MLAMSDILRLYISATTDLDFEREVLNRAITEIPTTLAWQITLTPLTHEEPDTQAITEADVHLLLLGGDVRAPIGVEWLAARRAGFPPERIVFAGVGKSDEEIALGLEHGIGEINAESEQEIRRVGALAAARDAARYLEGEAGPLSGLAAFAAGRDR